MRIRHIKGAEETIACHPLCVQNPENYKGRWRQEIFSNDAPLYIEIGTGMGTFIRESAIKNPGINYVGLEMNSTVLLKAINRYEKAVRESIGISAESAAPVIRNLRFIRCDARLI